MIVGSRVKWRHVDPSNGLPVRKIEGVVLACERGGTPAVWSLLIMQEDGSMTYEPVDNLAVVETPKTTQPFASWKRPEDCKPVYIEQMSTADCGKLDKFLDEEFEKESEVTGVDRAIQLLTLLKQDVLEITAERNSLKEANTSLSELLKFSRKKPKGPAGPAEG